METDHYLYNRRFFYLKNGRGGRRRENEAEPQSEWKKIGEEGSVRGRRKLATRTLDKGELGQVCSCSERRWTCILEIEIKKKGEGKREIRAPCHRRGTKRNSGSPNRM